VFESAPKKTKKAMGDLELLGIVEAQEKRALGYGDGELSQSRSNALKYYNGELLGNEVEGRSQVRTSEVFDTVEWILPSLLRIFTASDKAVEFSPERQEDEEGAKQSTLAANYVFYRQNPGFTILYSFFKDALLEKNGYVEVYYDKSKRQRKEQYQGLSREQLVMLVSRPEVEVLSATSYPDPTFQAQPDPMAAGVGQALGAPVTPPELFDVQIQVEEEYGKVQIENVAPEEMLVDSSHKDVDLQGSNFVARRFQKTISELEELGYDTSQIVTEIADSGDVETSNEFLTRKQYSEERLYAETDTRDRSMRKVWVTKAFIRVDFDGDGIAELRRVVKVGKALLENEETDVIPFASCTPIIQTHRHIGKSVAEIVMELEKIATTLTRQMLDNVYLTNAPRLAVQSTPEGAPMANLDDLLTVRPGGIVRHWGSQAPTPLEVPFMGQYGIQALEYMNTVKENRTGVTRYNQGVDANSLNKTASGISQIMNASQQRIELIARVFAETGVKQIFKLIQHCLMTYHNKPMIVRLTDNYVEVDPRGWSDQYDMVINVGLGTGDKDQQLQHLMTMAEAQFQYLQAGAPIVTMENIYNTQAKIAENAGFKNVEEFWTDPNDPEKQPPPQQQQPDPALIAEQNKMQLEAAKLQQSSQAEAMKAQQTAQIEQMRLAASQQSEQMKIESARQIEAVKLQAQQQAELMKAQTEAALEAQRIEFDRWKAELEAQTKITVAQISAHASMEKAELAADQANEVEEPAGNGTFKKVPREQKTAEHVSKMVGPMLAGLANQVKGMAGRDVVRIERLKGPDGRLAGARRHHADGTTSEVAVV